MAFLVSFTEPERKRLITLLTLNWFILMAFTIEDGGDVAEGLRLKAAYGGTAGTLTSPAAIF